MKHISICECGTRLDDFPFTTECSNSNDADGDCMRMHNLNAWQANVNVYISPPRSTVADAGRDAMMK